MDEARQFMERLFDEESTLMAEWIALDPGYTDHRFDLADACVCMRADVPDGHEYTGIFMPTSFGQHLPHEVTPATQDMADRFVRRQVLRRDDYDVPGLGRVAAFATSKTDVTNPDHHPWVRERFVVGPAKSGLRVLRVDIPCLECMSTGGASGAGCGWQDDIGGASCDRGWLSRGGVLLPLLTPVATERLVRPKDAGWHAWYDG